MGTFSDPETKYENPEQGKNVRDTQKSRADQDKEEENEPVCVSFRLKTATTL